MRGKNLLINKLSEIGNYHRNNNEENQDALSLGKNGRFSVISLADGVSCCKKAAEGAEIASDAVTNLLLKNGSFFLNLEKEKTADMVVSHILYELKRKSEKSGYSVNDYSSTIASVLFDCKTGKMLFFNLGDSLIIATKGGKCKVISMPYNSLDGCCVTTTKNAKKAVNTEVINGFLYDSIVIFSDGAWKKILNQNYLKECVKTMIEGKEYEQLKDFFRKQNCSDDYSFIALDLRDYKRRYTAYERKKIS